MISRRQALGLPILVAVGFSPGVTAGAAWPVWSELNCRDDLAALGAYCRATSAALRRLQQQELEARLAGLSRIDASQVRFALREAIRSDQLEGRVEHVGLWRLSRTEVELGVLAALCFPVGPEV